MEINQFRCELCEHDKFVEVPYITKYTGSEIYHICKNCGFVQYLYRKNPDEIVKWWKDYEFGNKENIKKRPYYSSQNPFFKSRHTYAIEFIKDKIGLEGRRVIDIGAGEGNFLELVRANDADVFAIEPSVHNHELLDEKKIANFCGTIEEYSAEENTEKANLVTLLWTLQNTQNASSMLQTINRLLDNNGYLFLQLSVRVLNPFSKPMGLFFSKQPGFIHPYIFSINSLTSLLAKNGFETTHANNYWEQDVLNLIVQKKARIEKKYMYDNYNDVVNFFIRWHNESNLMKEYISIIDLDYFTREDHTFFKQ